MGTFVVIYSYAEDSDATRDEHRPAHRAFLRGLHEEGRLKLSGPFGPGVAPGGLLILEGESAEEVASTLDEDPFWKVDVIADRSIRPYEVVVGGFA